MRVLLTGAAGFIGGAVRRALEAAGHEVVALDAFIPQAHGTDVPSADVHRRDLRSGDGLADLLTGVDVVCHQAAMVGAGTSPADLPLYAGHNDLGTAVLLAAMARAGVHRLVQASSMVVYGDGRYDCPQHGEQAAQPRELAALRAGRFDVLCPHCARPMGWLLVDEDAPLAPLSSYAASKLAQEHYAAAWARQVPARAVSLRYHNVYGPGMPADTPYSGVAAIFRSALAHREAPRVFEDGTQTRDFVHVDDVAAANVAAVDRVAERPDGSHRAYNVCSGHPVTIHEVASALVAADGRGLDPIVTGEFRPGDVRHVVASPARAAAELGFTAQVPPEAGLRDFASEPMRGQ